MRKVYGVLQSYTFSLPLLHSFCSETCIDAYDVIDAKREEDRDLDCQVEEIPLTI